MLLVLILGKTPYSDMTTTDVGGYVISGRRLQRPEHTPDGM